MNDLEEDIKILNNYLDENDKKFVKPKRLKFLQAIENLIDKNKELEKMVEEMASFIEVAELDEDIAKTYCKNEACTEINKFNCQKCIIDYFRKKAKGE